MRDSFTPIEFQELSINLSKAALHQFIKRMMGQHYALFWRYDAKTIYLTVELGELTHELPFIRNDEFLTMQAKVLYVYDDVLSDASGKPVAIRKRKWDCQTNQQRTTLYYVL
jgi:hypothetical protein